jgi:hypothetical protein
MPNFAAGNPKTILEYSQINRVQVAEGEIVFDGAEWVRQKMYPEPLKYTNH